MIKVVGIEMYFTGIKMALTMKEHENVLLRICDKGDEG